MRSLGTKLTISFGMVVALGALVMMLVVGYTAYNGLDQFINELFPAEQIEPPRDSDSSSSRNNNNNDNNSRSDSRTRRFEEGTPAGNFEDELVRGISLGVGAGVLLALIIGYVLAQRLIRPIQTLTQATEKLSHGNFGHQIPVTTNDEIGDLTMAFNQMSQDLAQSNQLASPNDRRHRPRHSHTAHRHRWLHRGIARR